VNPFHFITHQAVRDWEVSMSSRDVDTPVVKRRESRRREGATRVARFSSQLRSGLLSARRRLLWGS
jgi:hypothetical protein